MVRGLIISLLLALPLPLGSHAQFLSGILNVRGTSVPACGAIGSPCTDSFPGTSLSSNWVTNVAVWQVASGQAQIANSGYVHGEAYYNAATFTNDQFAEVTVGTVSGTEEYGPSIRNTSSGAYRLGCNGTSLTLWVVTWPSSYTLLGTSTCSSGDQLFLGASGTTITGYDVTLGSTHIAVADSTWGSGYPGLAGYRTITPTTGVSNWIGGDQP